MLRMAPLYAIEPYLYNDRHKAHREPDAPQIGSNSVVDSELASGEVMIVALILTRFKAEVYSVM
ncbi:hypothetical protein A9Z50_12280 [Aeromonas hydrophila]|nr:hypothetical protein [Aeromonas hydrophila]